MSKVFEKTNVYIGEVKEKTKATVVFQTLFDIKVISMQPSCGCTNPKFEDGKIKVTVNVGEIPHHLKDLGYSMAKQHIKVVFEYKGIKHYETLYFDYKIVK